MANGSKLNRQLSDLESRRDDLTRRVEELEATLTQETAAHAKLKNAHLDAAESHRLIASNLQEELGAMTSRSEAAERLLAEARATLRERDAEIRGFEQRALESSLALKSKDAALADLEKDLASARALHAEVDNVRVALEQRSAELAKALEAKDAALQRAEQKIAIVEGRIPSRARRSTPNGRRSRKGSPSSRSSSRPSRPRAPSPKGRCKPHGRNAALGATTPRALARRKTRKPRPAKRHATKSRALRRLRRVIAEGTLARFIETAWAPARSGGTGPCFAARETSGMLQMISRRRSRLAFALRRRGC